MHASLLYRVFVPVIFCVALLVPSLAQEKQSAPKDDSPLAKAKARLANTTPPRPIFTPDPEYSDDARKHRVHGEVVLAVTVEADGTTSNIKVEESLKPDLDQNAIDAVKRWKFEPATKDGRPVAVSIHVNVSFRLPQP